MFGIDDYPNPATSFFEYSVAHAVYRHLNEVNENIYEHYPDNDELMKFDPPDRKFIALSYGYPEAVPIVEAADSKWWGIADILAQYDIEVIFIDEDYIKMKYMVKMGIQHV